MICRATSLNKLANPKPSYRFKMSAAGFISAFKRIKMSCALSQSLITLRPAPSMHSPILGETIFGVCLYEGVDVVLRHKQASVFLRESNNIEFKTMFRILMITPSYHLHIAPQFT